MEKKVSCAVAGGFVCQYQFEDGSSQFIFLHIDSKTGAAKGTNNSLNFSTKNYVQVISSCQGLLLLSSTRKHDRLDYHVHNPISKHSVTLPQPGITKHNIIRSGLAYDGDQYQVVLVHVGDGCLEMEIFSSETGNWRRHRPIDIPSLAIPVTTKSKFPQLNTPSLFCNGAIHWEIGGQLLIYHVRDDHCELIELPNFSESEEWSWQSTTDHKQKQCCLWESKGRVQYSYTDPDGVQIWVLLNEHDHNCYSYYNIYDRKKFRWALAHSINHQNLDLKHQDLGNTSLSPLAFVEESETTYFQLPGFVVSYNTRTQAVEEVCTYKFARKNFSCCSFFPIVYGSSLFLPSELQEVGVVNLPIKEKLDTFSFLSHKEYVKDQINKKMARRFKDQLKEYSDSNSIMAEVDKHHRPQGFIKFQMKRLYLRFFGSIRRVQARNLKKEKGALSIELSI